MDISRRDVATLTAYQRIGFGLSHAGGDPEPCRLEPSDVIFVRINSESELVEVGAFRPDTWGSLRWQDDDVVIILRDVTDATAGVLASVIAGWYGLAAKEYERNPQGDVLTIRFGLGRAL